MTRFTDVLKPQEQEFLKEFFSRRFNCKLMWVGNAPLTEDPFCHSYIVIFEQNNNEYKLHFEKDQDFTRVIKNIETSFHKQYPELLL